MDALWHRRAVGGLWEEMGQLQLDFMVRQGLKPEHRFLDIGCGSLRGGIHFIRYLEPGNYLGIDADGQLLEAGRGELAEAALAERQPVLVEMADFALERLGQSFDMALAQSVFTHLALNDIVRCLVGVGKVLLPGGRFYATFFENPLGKHHLGPLNHRTATGDELVTHFAADPYHYDVGTFQWAAEGTGLHVVYLGAWGHPRDQQMLRFEKETPDGPISSANVVGSTRHARRGSSAGRRTSRPA